MKKGKMKRSLAVLLCAMQLLSCVPHVHAEEVASDNEVLALEHTHLYVNGQCECGEICPHDGIAHNGTGMQEQLSVTSNGDTHTRSFRTYHTYECPICSYTENRLFEENASETEAHEYGGGENCVVCGEEKLCENHDWSSNNGVCAACGTACSHSGYAGGVCVTCGTPCSHSSYAGGVCAACGMLCMHSWSDGVCSQCGVACLHPMGGENLGYEMIEGTPVYKNEEFHTQPYTVITSSSCYICGHIYTESSDMQGDASHTYGGDGKCACGAEGETTTCTHENTEFRYFDENVDYTNITETTHTKKADVYFSNYCIDCDTRLTYQLDIPGAETVESHSWSAGTCTGCGTGCAHDWNTGVCSICSMEHSGHTIIEGACSVCGKPCTHDEHDAVASGEETKNYGAAEIYDEAQHKLSYTLIQPMKCPDCGAPQGEETSEGYDLEAHTFVDNVCISCGYTCGHADKELLESNTLKLADGAQWTPNGDNTHVALATLGNLYFCPNCEHNVFEALNVQQEYILPCNEDENGDGLCDECGGAIEICEHANRSDNFYYYDTMGVGVFTDNGDGTHTGMAVEMYGFWCNDCSKYIAEPTHEDLREYTKPHDFNEEGVCDADGCGAEKVCETHNWENADGVCAVCGMLCGHESTEPNLDDVKNIVYGDAVQYTAEESSVGHEVHKRNFTGELYHYCTTCGAHVLTTEMSGSESETHSFTSGVCSECAYVCAHSFEDGVCGWCGEALPEETPTPIPAVTSTPAPTAEPDDDFVPTPKPNTNTNNNYAPVVAATPIPTATPTPEPTAASNEPEMINTLLSSVEAAEAEGSDVTIEIIGAEYVFTEEDHEKLEQLPVKEQILVALSTIGFADVVEAAMTSMNVTLSNDAFKLIEQANASVSEMTQEEREQMQKAIETHFPKRQAQINGVIRDYFVLEMEIIVDGVARIESYGFYYDEALGQWIFATLETLGADDTAV